MENRKSARSLVGGIMFVCVVLFNFSKSTYAYIPSENQIVKSKPNHYGTEGNQPAYDIWGQTISQKKANELLKTKEGKALLSPQNGAVKIDRELLKLGRESFYEETFGNEVFLTDIMGILNGALTLENIKKAIYDLHGKGTTNLRVELAKTVKIGDKTFEKGTKVDTGLDVSRGSNEVLGMPIIKSEGREKIGVSCAACHATVTRDTKKVIEGAANNDFNGGLILALGTNSAAYFSRAEIKSLQDYIKDLGRTVVTSDGKKAPLPDPGMIEETVDRTLLKWPRGNFDASSDLVNNPTQIPDSFTFGDHPYGWNGFAQAGPFKGLSVINSAVNIQGSDLTTLAHASPFLFKIDKEVYLGTMLQNAANLKYRYDPKSGKKPSEFFASVDPTPGVPGVNELIALPTFPRPSLISPNGLLSSSPGYRVMEQNNGMSALQNTFVSPKPPLSVDDKTMKKGKNVFARAGCITCHAGQTYTNNRIIPVNEIKTEPSRAKSFEAIGKNLAEPIIYSPDTSVPVPKGAKLLKVPAYSLDKEKINLAYMLNSSPGGYKVPSLLGLYWGAPYLHDGGVAVGQNVESELGMTGTVSKGIEPNPFNSLRALIDQNLRRKVIEANKNSKDLQDAHITGEGHEYWVDSSTGFSKQEQDALINYLLTLE
ncbi:hypothetical protein BACCIP111899_02263 [Bacillus rhizoplanae]|uniref:Cytochrome c domain-containing protein n=1 Tax=Bacillus rhizoplanae TaxID=2880966 RepID=A0ABM8YBF9_9BACI|nr:electron transport protein [Bacillus rhizoplanae]CAG9613068.1 hypothetical protein BACCIP111899_02263 [Bacillus rhizoplanae]